MANLAIRGHETRGKEVIEILEMLGGWNNKCLHGVTTGLYYFIDYNEICSCESVPDTYAIFTLEEILERFPYKVGDKVIVDKNVEIINRMRWTGNEIVYGFFTTHDLGELTMDMIQPYKEEVMEDMNEKSVNHVYDTEIISFDIAQKDKYELDLQGNFEIKLREGKYFVERIKPRYPKTYEECCKTLNLTNYPPSLVPNRSMYISPYKDFPHYYEIQKLAELLICRDAYWKMAGEQMGLGKPWEPDWTESDEIKYCIVNAEGNITKWVQKTTNTILAFPTSEMRDEFCKNFKDLIEQCKELL